MAQTTYKMGQEQINDKLMNSGLTAPSPHIKEGPPITKGQTMPKRCADPECGRLVSERKPHCRLQDLVFCGLGCLNDYMKQVARFEQASLPFHEPMYDKRKPWWER